MAVETSDSKPRFKLSAGEFNPDGWGPCSLPDKFKDMPYQLFSKETKIGKVADWTGNIYPKRHYNKYVSQFGSGSQYAYYHEEDESTFQLVDTNRQQKTPYQKQRMRFNAQRLRRERERRNQTSNFASMVGVGQGMLSLNKTQMLRERERMRQIQKFSKQYFGRQQTMDYTNQGKRMAGRTGQQTTMRDSSVKIKPDYEVKEELDFPRLLKLSLPGIKDPIDLHCCGEMQYYDKTNDRVSTRNEKRLKKVNRVIHMVTTTHDPIIRQLAREEKGNVFCTDSILATLMCCTRSVYSWDIIIHRIGNNLFLDKREDSDFDLLTVNETSVDQPHEEPGHINSAKNLALEATFIQHNFSQLVLKSDTDEPRYKFPKPNPFIEDQESVQEIASVGYRYRKWDLGNGINLVCRCEHDAVTVAPNQTADSEGVVQFLTIKTLNEWDCKLLGGVDWRSRLDTQRGAVLAAELKNNAFKLAKWTICSQLAGSDQIKFGFVSRINPKDSTKHVILGTQQFKPSEFATQINLNIDNCWGILRCIIDMCMKFPEGKYLTMKDPNKPMVRIYKIPDNEFDTEGEYESETDDEEEQEDAEDEGGEANDEPEK